MKKIKLAHAALALTGIAGAVALPFLLSGHAKAAQGPPNKSIIIKCTSIRIQDEDDPISNDEPYLINIGFRCKIKLNGTKASVEPGTLTTHTIGTPVHNNLGRSGDNWADEVNNYGFSTQNFAASVPRTEAGWAVGVVSVFWEEDGFSDSTANVLRGKISTAVRTAIQNLSMNGIDTNAITQPLAAKILRDLGRAAKKFDLGGVIQAIASAADPDDFGGANIIIAFTLPNNAVMMFAGIPPENVASAPLTNVPANSPVNFDVGFPAGAISAVPWNARYTGKCRIRGTVTQSG